MLVFGTDGNIDSCGSVATGWEGISVVSGGWC